MPSPLPISSYRDHCLGVPRARRGNHSTGIETTRRSTSSTVRNPLATLTDRARGSVLMSRTIGSQEQVSTLHNQVYYATLLGWGKALQVLPGDGIQPELGDPSPLTDVDVRGLVRRLTGPTMDAFLISDHAVERFAERHEDAGELEVSVAADLASSCVVSLADSGESAWRRTRTA